jgi:hypothetical protein
VKRTQEFFKGRFEDVLMSGADDILGRSMSASTTGNWRQENPQEEQKIVKDALVQQQGG